MKDIREFLVLILQFFQSLKLFQTKKLRKKVVGVRIEPSCFFFPDWFATQSLRHLFLPNPPPEIPRMGQRPVDTGDRERAGRERLVFWKDRGWRHDVEDYSGFFHTDIFVMFQWLQQTHGLLKFWRRVFFFFFCLCPGAYPQDLSSPTRPEIEPGSSQWKPRTLTTGLLEKSLEERFNLKKKKNKKGLLWWPSG